MTKLQKTILIIMAVLIAALLITALSIVTSRQPETSATSGRLE